MTAKAKGPSFDDNRARLEPLLVRLKSEGIGHVIGGGRVDGKSTFDTCSPVDKSATAKVALGTAADVDRAAAAAKSAFKAWAAWSPDKRRALLHKIADAIEARADEIAVLECRDTGQPYRFMSKAAVRAARELPLLRRSCAGRPRRPQPADRRALELHHPRADRSGRHHHAVEHAVHAVDLEDRAGAGGGLHGRAQAGRVVARHRRPARAPDAGRRGCRTACSTRCTASARRPARR